MLSESTIVRLVLSGNPLRKGEFMEMDGAPVFMDKRAKLKSKELHAGLFSDLSVCGLDS